MDRPCKNSIKSSQNPRTLLTKLMLSCMRSSLNVRKESKENLCYFVTEECLSLVRRCFVEVALMDTAECTVSQQITISNVH